MKTDYYPYFPKDDEIPELKISLGSQKEADDLKAYISVCAGISYKKAQFDFRDQLLKDLTSYIADEVRDGVTLGHMNWLKDKLEKMKP